MMNFTVVAGLAWAFATSAFVAIFFQRRKLALQVAEAARRPGPSETPMAIQSRVAMEMRIQGLLFPLRATGLLSIITFFATVGAWLFTMAFAPAEMP